MILWILCLFGISASDQRLTSPRGVFRNPSTTSDGPKPYNFQYNVQLGGSGSQHSRSESSDDFGRVQGYYSLNDGLGHYRRVNYTADENGFCVTIETNEPGMGNQNPACVSINPGSHQKRRWKCRVCSSTPYRNKTSGVPARNGIQNDKKLPTRLQYRRPDPPKYQTESKRKLNEQQRQGVYQRTGTYNPDEFHHAPVVKPTVYQTPIRKPPAYQSLRTTKYPEKHPAAEQLGARTDVYHPTKLHLGQVETNGQPHKFKCPEKSAQNSRGQSVDKSGRIEGYYTVYYGDGHCRRVNYTADEKGFRASIETNEPGAGNQNPANVNIKLGSRAEEDDESRGLVVDSK